MTIEIYGDYEICPVCGWEDECLQSEDPDYAGGPNKMSLNEAKKAYQNTERLKAAIS